MPFPQDPRLPRDDPGQRLPALLWALLHFPVLAILYYPAISAAVGAAPPRFRIALWPIFPVQGLVLGLLAWLVALPCSRWPRLYRYAAPAVAGFLTAVLALDSQVYRAVGFHLNGFFLRVLLQRSGLSEVGFSPGLALALVAAALALVILDALAGAWFIRRRPIRRRTWTIAAALLAIGLAERVYGQVLQHFGGPAIFAASGVLPLQAPIRIGSILGALLGKEKRDPFAGADQHRLPSGVDPGEIRFTRRPDVLFVLAESMPHDHLDERTLPGVWRRAAGGARFTRHYSSACATHYAVFSLFYGLQAQKLEAIVGSGRRSVLFSAFRANGYGVHALAASCVDWMGLKETVFGEVDGLETWCEGEALARDRAMIERARAILRAARADQPIFMFLFFDATHFAYQYDPQDRLFEPEWDGAAGLRATNAEGWHIKNRARNAARTLDRSLDAFLEDFEAARGREPLVVFTGDHGEEFRQKGHLGHGSDVTDEQVHVPAALFGPGVPKGVFDAPTSHIDLAPTLLALLGDAHPPALYSDGMDMFRAPPDRFVVTTVGWEPRYAVIGKDLKVRMYAGLGSTDITDPDDRPLPDGPARLARSAGKVLRAMRGEAEPVAATVPGRGP
jgi:membrane-anchored protein YejM (alkaline phosphatase superfamily)